MKILSREEMEKLPTKRLLAYKTKLLQVSDAWTCDCGSSGCDFRREQLLKDGAFIKASPLWQQIYAAVKDILSKREHISRD